MNKVYEVVRYLGKESVSDQEILKVSKELQELVKSQQGYVERRLAKSENEEWIDVVVWESLEDARAAAKLVNSQPIAGKFVELVQMNSVVFKHYEILTNY